MRKLRLQKRYWKTREPAGYDNIPAELHFQAKGKTWLLFQQKSVTRYEERKTCLLHGLIRWLSVSKRQHPALPKLQSHQHRRAFEPSHAEICLEQDWVSFWGISYLLLNPILNRKSLKKHAGLREIDGAPQNRSSTLESISCIHITFDRLWHAALKALVRKYNVNASLEFQPFGTFTKWRQTESSWMTASENGFGITGMLIISTFFKYSFSKRSRLVLQKNVKEN